MIPVSLQLWSVREDVQRDFAATVAEVARIGYAGVELAGYGQLDARGARTALTAAGLRVSGLHVSVDRLRGELPQVVSEALILDTRHVIAPWWPPEQLATVAQAVAAGEELNRIGAALRRHGLRLSYHNHAAEFRVIEGQPVFAWLLAAAEPRNLGAELDVYWSHTAGYWPVKFLREQGARVSLLHLKDEKELGLGPVRFAEIFSAADEISAVEWYVVEQEQYNHAPLESVRRCFEQLRAWGKV